MLLESALKFSVLAVICIAHLVCLLTLTLDVAVGTLRVKMLVEEMMISRLWLGSCAVKF